MPKSRPATSAFVSTRIVTPKGVLDGAVVVQAGKIVDVGRRDEVSDSVSIRDFGNLVVMPGLIDPHVHINEPGRTEWEGFATATRAAAAGGTTFLVDMPLNSDPVTTTSRALTEKVEAARGKLQVDCGFYGGLVPGNIPDLPRLLEGGVLGIKAFMIDSGIADFPPADAVTIAAGMSVIAKYDVPLLVHAELGQPGSVQPPGPQTRYLDYLASRPASWETDAVRLMAALSSSHDCAVHVVHLSASASLSIISSARAGGARLTVETCPHYLYFDAESIVDGSTLFKCAPPIRDRHNNDLLFEALSDGEIDFVASDHSPVVPSAKAIESGDFTKAWGGIASLQLRLPVMWTLARSHGLSLEHVTSWLSSKPAQFLGLSTSKGRLAPGGDADFVVWDPEREFTVTTELLHDRHKLTPYLGRRLFGRVHATYLRGEPVFQVDAFSEPRGRIVLRPARAI